MCLILLWGGCFADAWSQSSHVVHYEAGQELPSSKVYRVKQDRQGFIWMATESGVVQFDGLRSRVFTIKDGLPSNDMLNLYEDREGRMWLMPFSGGFSYIRNGRVYNEKNDPSLAYPLTKHPKNFCFESSAGDLYFSLEGGSAVRYDGQKMEPTVSAFSPRTGKTCLIWEVGQDTIMARAGQYLARLHPDPTILTDTLPIARNAAAHWISPDKKTGIFAMTDGQVIEWSGYQSRRIMTLPVLPFVNKIGKTENEDLWFCTNEGTFIFRQNPTGEYDLIAHYLEDLPTTYYMEDREQNIWISTYGDGIYRYRPYGVVNHNPAIFRGHPQLRAVNRSPSGKLFFAMTNKVLIESDQDMDPDSARFLPLSDGKEANKIISMPDSSMVVLGRGLIHFRDAYQLDHLEQHDAREAVSEFSNQDVFLVSSIGNVRDGFVHSDGRLWLASSNMFGYYDPVRPPGSRTHRVVNERCTAICEGPEGSIWTSTMDGLHQLVDSQLVMILPEEPMLRQTMTCMAYVPGSGFWMGTNGSGLLWYQPETEQVRQYTVEDFFPSNQVNDLLVKDNYLFVSTMSGICRVQLDALAHQPLHQCIRTIGQDEGLLSEQINGAVLAGDSIGLATYKGYSTVPLSAFDIQLPPPYTRLESIVAGDSTYFSDEKAVLPHDQNSVQFAFRAISISSGAKIRFRYRLLPIEARWSNSHLSEAHYSQLAPGSYTFQVQAQDKRGVWSENTETYDFVILAAWYQRTWFIVLMVLLGLGIAYALFHAQFRAIRRREALRRKLTESESKALRAQMNPHFIFNSLNSIQNFLAQNDRKAAYTYMARFGKLMRSMLENSESGEISVGKEIETLDLYLQLECLRTDDQFTYTIQVDEQVDRIRDKIPPMLLQPYVENAIWHGLVASPHPGHLHISILRQDNALQCTIEDNGIGREAASKRSKGDFQAHKSYGMRLSRERLELLNQGQQDMITVVVEDLHHPDGSAAGTRVRLAIPLKKNS